MRRLARLNHRVEIEDIANALLTSGYTSLKDQAQALGLHYDLDHNQGETQARPPIHVQGSIPGDRHGSKI